MMLIWWKYGNVIFDSANWREIGIMDHSLKPWARKSYGGYDGQMRLWIGSP